MEGDDAGILASLRCFPRNSEIGMLLSDFSLPRLLVVADLGLQRKCVSSSCSTLLIPSMNEGNFSNCVHWLYAVLTGTSTSIVSVMLAISLPCFGSGYSWPPQEPRAETDGTVRIPRNPRPGARSVAGAEARAVDGTIRMIAVNRGEKH